jgi:hypothetical protein
MKQKAPQRYISRIEKFYAELTEVSKNYGYMLDFFAGEVSECKAKVETMSFEDFQAIYIDDLLQKRKNRYSFFLEDNERLTKILKRLAQRGYIVAFNFTAPDAFLGNVTLEIGDKWFAIGECARCYSRLPSNEDGELILEHAGVETLRLWSPFYVLSNPKRMETQLILARPV